MGYPMTYSRVLSRNRLGGNYTSVRNYNGVESSSPFASTDDDAPVRMISGDLRRLERDAIDPGYWRETLAERAGVTEDVIVQVLTAFFDGPLPNIGPHDNCTGHTHIEGVCQNEEEN